MTAGRLYWLLPALLLAGCGVKERVSNYMAGESNTTPPAALVEIKTTLAVTEGWRVRFGKGADKQFLKLEPIAVQDHIYVAERGGKVAAFNTADGKQLWEANVDLPIAGGPGSGEGLVLVGTSDGEVIALNETDGKEVWRARATSEVLAAPIAAHGVVVVHSGDGTLLGLNAKDGKRLWNYDRPVPSLSLRGSSPPVVVKEMVVVGFDNGRVAAFEISTGKLVWDTQIAIGTGRSDLERMVDIDTQPLVMGDMIYVATFQGRVAAVSVDSGEIAWSREFSSYAGLGVDDKNVYITDSDGMVLALEREGGASRWKQDKLKARASSAPAAVGEYVVVGDVEGYLHWMRRDDGEFVNRVRIDESPILAPPLSYSGTLYVYTANGTLAAFHPQ